MLKNAPEHTPQEPAPPTAGGAHVTSAATEPSWDDLVTTALLGTDRRALPASVHTPGKEAPIALLDAAALQTVRRRAGLRAAPAAAL
ncbi:hypothetical protein G3I45_37750, partial [Streptomyces sp. SID339]|nr:hypothetical protein [Streptomyces sp. SID339]